MAKISTIISSDQERESANSLAARMAIARDAGRRARACARREAKQIAASEVEDAYMNVLRADTAERIMRDAAAYGLPHPDVALGAQWEAAMERGIFDLSRPRATSENVPYSRLYHAECEGYVANDYGSVSAERVHALAHVRASDSVRHVAGVAYLVLRTEQACPEGDRLRVVFAAHVDRVTLESLLLQLREHVAVDGALPAKIKVFDGVNPSGRALWIDWNRAKEEARREGITGTRAAMVRAEALVATIVAEIDDVPRPPSGPDALRLDRLHARLQSTQALLVAAQAAAHLDVAPDRSAAQAALERWTDAQEAESLPTEPARKRTRKIKTCAALRSSDPASSYETLRAHQALVASLAPMPVRAVSRPARPPVSTGVHDRAGRPVPAWVLADRSKSM